VPLAQAVDNCSADNEEGVSTQAQEGKGMQGREEAAEEGGRRQTSLYISPLTVVIGRKYAAAGREDVHVV